MKKILMVMAIAVSATLFADTQSEWYYGITERQELGYVVVGEEEVKVSEIDNGIHYFQGGRAVLAHSLTGWKLTLYGAAIGGRCSLRPHSVISCFPMAMVQWA